MSGETKAIFAGFAVRQVGHKGRCHPRFGCLAGDGRSVAVWSKESYIVQTAVRVSLHLDIRPQRTVQSVRLNAPYSVDSCQPSLESQLWSGWGGLQASSWIIGWSRPGDEIRAQAPSSVIGWGRPGGEFQTICKEGQLEKALDLLFGMDQQGIVPSVEMYGSLLKACTKRKALVEAKQVHTHLAKHGLESVRFLGELVVITLTKCGGLEHALQVFDRLPNRTVFSWTAVISGYTAAGQGHQALRMYHCMREEGLEPDTYTLVTVLKACGSICDLTEGRRVHAEALKYGCETDVIVGTCLVDMYSKCGSIVDARDIFSRLAERDVVAWTTMLSAYVQEGKAKHGLELYGHMLEEGVNPNDRTLVCAFQMCSMLAEEEEDEVVDGQAVKVQTLGIGRALHFEAWRSRWSTDLFIGSALVSMYGKCMSTADARNVFDKMLERNVVSWNAMLTAYALQGQVEKCLELYERMVQEGVSPDDRTFVSLIQACSMPVENEEDILPDGHYTKWQSLQKAKAVHAEVWSRGFESDVYVGSALVSMYGKCGSIMDARDIFDGLLQRNVVSWNAMLAAYAQQDQAQKALEVYEQMVGDAMSPNDRTFVCALQACGMLAEKEDSVLVDEQMLRVKYLDMGKALHADAWKRGCKSDVFVISTLVSMYGKCGSIVDAEHVFKLLSQEDVVVWNAMFAAYLQHGKGDKALELYTEMQEGGLSPNEITLVHILQACSNTGSLDVCMKIHHDFICAGILFSSLLENTLIHAYGRCGSMLEAQKVFNALSQPNVISWNALIAGYAREGNFGASLQSYEKMLVTDVRPDGVTFVSLLSACSHGGLVDRGIGHFESMTKCYGITPEIEHYVSMVDLLGRAGYFDQVEDLLSAMPMQPDLSIWLCLLGACRKHGKVVLGNKVFACAVHLQPRHAAPYVLMSNIYANAGLWDSAAEVNELRQQAGAGRKPGHSWLVHGQEVHTFVVQDPKLHQRELRYLLVRVSSELKEATAIAQLGNG